MADAYVGRQAVLLRGLEYIQGTILFVPEFTMPETGRNSVHMTPDLVNR